MNHRLTFSFALQIAYLEGDGNYTKTHNTSGYTCVRRSTLAYSAERYPSFVRIHKQYAVNPDRIMAVVCRTRLRKRPCVEIVLSTKKRLPVSERRVEELLPLLQQIVDRNKRWVRSQSGKHIRV
jgi:DNA-binding LytR/AlgR family response regulator